MEDIHFQICTLVLEIWNKKYSNLCDIRKTMWWREGTKWLTKIRYIITCTTPVRLNRNVTLYEQRNIGVQGQRPLPNNLIGTICSHKKCCVSNSEFFRKIKTKQNIFHTVVLYWSRATLYKKKNSTFVDKTFCWTRLEQYDMFFR